GGSRHWRLPPLLSNTSPPSLQKEPHRLGGAERGCSFREWRGGFEEKGESGEDSLAASCMPLSREPRLFQSLKL
ncbi:MAG: hypothetical protein NZ611_06495, partial [Bacteroidia bacterium]|nr:hypothetical protein [Bacteroidia bacterium]